MTTVLVQKIKMEKYRTCRFGHDTESTPNDYDTPGKELINEAQIHKDKKGVEHLHLPRTKSKR